MDLLSYSHLSQTYLLSIEILLWLPHSIFFRKSSLLVSNQRPLSKRHSEENTAQLMVSLSIVYSQQSQQSIRFYRSTGLEPIFKRIFLQGGRNHQTNQQILSREVQYHVVSCPRGIDSKT